MAAIQCRLGESLDRTSEVSIKQARAHFTLAAGQFSHIKEVMLKKINGSRTKDISPNVLTFLVQGCLANAQACYYEMSAISQKMSNKVRVLPGKVSAFFTYVILGLKFSLHSCLLSTGLHFVHGLGEGSPGHRHTRQLHESQRRCLPSRCRCQMGHSIWDAGLFPLGCCKLLAVQS